MQRPVKRKKLRLHQKRAWLLAEVFFLALLAILIAVIARRLISDAQVANEERRSAALMAEIEAVSATDPSEPSGPPPIQSALQELIADGTVQSIVDKYIVSE